MLHLPWGGRYSEVMAVDLFELLMYGSSGRAEISVAINKRIDTLNLRYNRKHGYTSEEELAVFDGINLYMMAFPMEGPKMQYFCRVGQDIICNSDTYYDSDSDGQIDDDISDSDEVSRLDEDLDSQVIRPDHGLDRYMSWTRYNILRRLFSMPEYHATAGSEPDPFSPIRKFADMWNSNMQNVFSPGHTVVVDESMSKWKGMRMPGLMHVPRKPTPTGREAHTVCDSETGILYHWEIYEGKERMANKEYIKHQILMPDGSQQPLGKGGAIVMRCCKSLQHSGRYAIYFG